MPTPDLQRLAEAIRARATALGWMQQDLISAAHDLLSRTTIQNLWTGDASYAPSKRTRAALEQVLGWTAGSVESVLAGGSPTVADSAEEAESATPETLPHPPLPLAVQLTLEGGRILDYRVITVDVDGEPLSVIALAQTSVYDTEEKKEVLRKQLDAFGRMTSSMSFERTDGSSESEDDDVTGS